MRAIEFDLHALDDLAWWIQHDRKTALRILKLLREVQQNPFEGTGKPEPLKHTLAGAWSRRLLKNIDLFIRLVKPKGEY